MTFFRIVFLLGNLCASPLYSAPWRLPLPQSLTILAVLNRIWSPFFQRPYTWGEQQWRTLREDVIAFYGREGDSLKSNHFMGAVVTMPARSVPVGVSKFLVIDGQQSLTTVAMLLSAIRDQLDVNDGTSKRRIQNHYLTNEGTKAWIFLNCFLHRAIETRIRRLSQRLPAAYLNLSSKNRMPSTAAACRTLMTKGVNSIQSVFSKS